MWPILGASLWGPGRLPRGGHVAVQSPRGLLVLFSTWWRMCGWMETRTWGEGGLSVQLLSLWLSYCGCACGICGLWFRRPPLAFTVAPGPQLLACCPPTSRGPLGFAPVRWDRPCSCRPLADPGHLQVTGSWCSQFWESAWMSRALFLPSLPHFSFPGGFGTRPRAPCPPYQLERLLSLFESMSPPHPLPSCLLGTRYLAWSAWGC